MRPNFLALLLLAPSFLQASSQSPTPVVEPHAVVVSEATKEAIFAKAAEASALVLTGEGGGRLSGAATAIVVRPNGVLLTAYHVLKNANEVQVRLHNGDVYDRAEMIGFDERRDIAAIRISASGLHALPMGDSSVLKPGDDLYTVSSSGGLQWSANQGIYSATRAADEVSGAGTGFRLLQTTIPVVPGASGGPVVDASGRLVGIFVRRSEGSTFAVPIESVAGLTEGSGHFALGSGAALQLPVSEEARTPAASAVAATKPADIMLHVKTAAITSKTAFFTPETLERTLTGDKDFAKLGITLVKDRRVADLVIEVDRPLFTYVHTYTIYDPKTTIVIGSGKVTAFDGTIASGPMAKQVIKILATKKAEAAAATKPAEPVAN